MTDVDISSGGANPSVNLTSLRVPELQALAASLGITNVARLRKGELVAAISDAQNDANDQNTPDNRNSTDEQNGTDVQNGTDEQNSTDAQNSTDEAQSPVAAESSVDAGTVQADGVSNSEQSAPAAVAESGAEDGNDAVSEASASDGPVEAEAAEESSSESATQEPQKAPAARSRRSSATADVSPAESTEVAPAEASSEAAQTEDKPAEKPVRARRSRRATTATVEAAADEPAATEEAAAPKKAASHVNRGETGITEDVQQAAENAPAGDAPEAGQHDGSHPEPREESPEQSDDTSRTDSESSSEGERPARRGRGRGRQSGEQNRQNEGGQKNQGDRQNDAGQSRNDRQNDNGGQRNQADSRQNDNGSNRQNQNDRQNDNSGQKSQGDNGQNRQQGGGQQNDEDRQERSSSRSRYRDRKRGRGAQNDDFEPEISDDDVLIPVAGILDVLDNYAFVRTSGYLPGTSDVYVSLGQVKKYNLRKGDAVVGAIRQPREGDGGRQKYNAIVKVDSVNGQTVDEAASRVEFGELTPLHPQERLRLETEQGTLSTRILDLVSPIGKGQRGLIVSPPKAGKTMILQTIAGAIAKNNPEAHLMVVLVDERPEEVTDMQRSVKGEVIASTFDRPAEDHTTLAELAIERAKRLVELGHDVVVLLDSITRLGRAYNLSAASSVRVAPSGVDALALHPSKRFFGAARNIENGGSLTILATALVETGSKVDEAIFEEFEGTANMELRLSRALADRRIFPAVDVSASGTRHEEMLMGDEEVQVTWKLRRALAGVGEQEALEVVLDKLKETGSNVEFLMQVQKSMPTLPSSGNRDS